MANRNKRLPLNIPGKYYVDDQCINCGVCNEIAPDNFGNDDDEGYSFIKKQPETPEEEDLVREAMENCPVEAIGDDGED